MIRRNQQILTQLYVCVDFLIIQLSFLLAWWLKFESGWIPYENPLPLETYTLWSLVYGLVAILTGFLFSVYTPKRKKRFADDFWKIIEIHIVSMFILLSLMFFFKEVNISRSYLAIYMAGNIIFTVTYRYALKRLLKSLREKGYNRQFVLVLGAGSLGKRFYNNLQQHADMGYEVIGFLDDYRKWDAEEAKQYKPIMGVMNELETILAKQMIDEVVLALPLDAHDKYPQIINTCEKAGVRTLIIPDFFDYLPARPMFDYFAGMPLINVRDIPLDLSVNRLAKRMFDISFSLAAIFITSPLMLCIMVGVRLTSPGPVIFKQERVGLNRRTFYMYKFRSMKILPEGTVDNGWTTKNDPRRTKFGSFLRATSLDELPQFFNVLFGHMSVVGPRPERPHFVNQFKEEVPKYMIKHHVRPGITGLAQSQGLRGDTSIEDRIEQDIFYIENWSLLFDIKIIFKTIRNGFKNAY
ncbi:undecaprenyl-phosphate glucose phosphotransferase [Paenibacillus sp. GYB006]|uniref:undecaprenyl-phosphate glucose phosphotransferase n=1 Tax=Paenibacillus sp. GYB006 TaxID=2994394 RepID=UPI002F96301D